MNLIFPHQTKTAIATVPSEFLYLNPPFEFFPPQILSTDTKLVHLSTTFTGRGRKRSALDF
jgi:hypothetical protein